MGRPREFDPAEALDKAMHLFWSKGYFDTSIRDLVARTGVNYYGLYDAFDSKHGLFLAALDHYRDTVTRDIGAALRDAEPGPDAIAAALTTARDRVQAEEPDSGCLMCNTAIELAPHDAEAAGKVQTHMTMMREAFEAVLREAQAAGTITADKDAAALAEFFATTTYSIGLLLRAGCGQDMVDRHIRTALSVLD